MIYLVAMAMTVVVFTKISGNSRFETYYANILQLKVY